MCYAYTQGSYKTVFEGQEHALFENIIATDEDDFIAIRLNYPFNTYRVISSDIYTFSNNNAEDTLRWNLDLFRTDTALSASSVLKLKDDRYIVCGAGVHFTDADTLIVNSRFNWLMSLDNMKNVIWERFYPLPEGIRKSSLIAHINLMELRSGSYLFAETVFNDSIPWIYNILLREIDSDGYLKKTVIFAKENSSNVMSLCYNNDSSAILLSASSGEVYDCINGIGAFILDTVNYDTIGRVCFKEMEEGFDQPYKAMLNSSGKLVVAGTYRNILPSPNESFLGIKILDTSYQVIHSNFLTAPDTTTYAAWSDCLDINAQGEICVAGSFDNALGFFTPYYDLVYLAKLDSELNLLSERYIGRDAEYSVFGMAATSDGGIAVGGYQYDYLVNEENEGDPFIIKTNAGLWLDIPQPTDFDIYRALVYPNPGSREINVRTTIKHVVFELYNLSGILVLESPLNQINTSINSTTIESGAYLWVIQKQGSIVERGKWMKY